MSSVTPAVRAALLDAAAILVSTAGDQIARARQGGPVAAAAATLTATTAVLTLAVDDAERDPHALALTPEARP